MEASDRKTFAIMFNQLLAYYPEANMNTNLVLDGYFEDLSPLSIRQVGMVFVEARRTCRFFPKISELLEIAQHLAAESRPAPACPRCPSGHGPHTGHRVSHYPAGPWCDTCNADMPTPAGYLTMPPAIRGTPTQPDPTLLPEYSQTPLTVKEAKEVIAEIMQVLDKKSEKLRGMADWVPTTNAERIAKRREELRNQAREIRNEAN